MTANEDKFNFETQRANPAVGKTVDLQGVAAFASLVEILAQELGTSAGKIQGLLPNGPANFEQLVGEISLVSQGFQRQVVLFTAVGEPLKIRISIWYRDPAQETKQKGLDVQIALGAPVENIVPQGRALARHLEELFSVLDRMVSLGMSNRLASMSISEAELAKFEYQESGGLVNKASYTPRT